MSILRYPDVNWSLPLLFSNDEYINSVAITMKRLNLKNPITYAYGMVPSLWTGGRISKYKTQDFSKIEASLNFVLSLGTTPVFTLSRHDIEKDDLNDEFCNRLLDFGVESGCEFIISSDLLYNHIKDRHPQAKCVASVLKTIFERETIENFNELNFYNQLLDKYERVVVRPEYGKTDLLKDYDKLKDLSKIEVLVNQICVWNCTYATTEHTYIPKKDWTLYNKEKNREQFEDKDDEPTCPRREMTKRIGPKANLTAPHLMYSEEEMNNLVYNLKIKNLKLQGRNYHEVENTRMINNYIFNGIGEYQNVLPIVLGNCERSRNERLVFQR